MRGCEPNLRGACPVGRGVVESRSTRHAEGRRVARGRNTGTGSRCRRRCRVAGAGVSCRHGRRCGPGGLAGGVGPWRAGSREEG